VFYKLNTKYITSSQKQHERVNMRSHVSTSRNPLYTDIDHTPTLPHTKFLFSLTECSKSTEESKHTPAL